MVRKSLLLDHVEILSLHGLLKEGNIILTNQPMGGGLAATSLVF